MAAGLLHSSLVNIKCEVLVIIQQVKHVCDKILFVFKCQNGFPNFSYLFTLPSVFYAS